MPQNQGTTVCGGIWIVEDDREVAQALLSYLSEHIKALEEQPTHFLPGPETIHETAEAHPESPAVVIVGTEHPNQTTLDVVHALNSVCSGALPLIIGLGIPQPAANENVFWELWPAAEEPALADRVRRGLFGGPQSPTRVDGAS